MKLIKGKDLSPKQIKHVKSAFIYRWTVENRERALACGIANNSNPVSDEQWILEHAFYFKNDGMLALKPNRCVPSWQAG